MVTSQADSTNHPQNNQSAEDEFVRLIVQYQRVLFVYLRTILNSTLDAEEVLQETCAILWRRRQQFVLGTNFVNWAMTVAQFEVRKFRRTRKHLPQVLNEELLEQITAEMVSEYDLAEARHRALVQCMESLNERDRHFIKSAYDVKTTKKAVGEQLGMTPTGFCKALYRVRQRLLKCIQHRLFTEGLS